MKINYTAQISAAAGIAALATEKLNLDLADSE